jgi:hypothetical protein
VREIEPATAGKKKLSPCRGHLFVDRDGDARVAKRLRGHQTGRTCADDCGGSLRKFRHRLRSILSVLASTQ